MAAVMNLWNTICGIIISITAAVFWLKGRRQTNDWLAEQHEWRRQTNDWLAEQHELVMNQMRREEASHVIIGEIQNMVGFLVDSNNLNAEITTINFEIDHLNVCFYINVNFENNLHYRIRVDGIFDFDERHLRGSIILAFDEERSRYRDPHHVLNDPMMGNFMTSRRNVAVFASDEPFQVPAPVIAAKRARNLLLEHLSDQQRQDFLRNDAFLVIGNVTKRTYRIVGSKPNYNVTDCLTQDMLCFVPKGDLAEGDRLLAQKIALETDEEETLKIANRSSRGGPFPMP